jgi:hypothetical protein
MVSSGMKKTALLLLVFSYLIQIVKAAGSLQVQMTNVYINAEASIVLYIKPSSASAYDESKFLKLVTHVTRCFCCPLPSTFGLCYHRRNAVIVYGTLCIFNFELQQSDPSVCLD